MLSFFTTTYTTVTRPVRTATDRARTSHRRTRRQARTAQLLTGLVTVGVGVALLIRADLGVASWDVLHVALASHTGASVGVVSVVVGVAAVGLATLLGERPRPGTLVPLLVIAPALDVTLGLVATPATLAGQTLMLTAGMLLMAFGVGAYVASDHGAGPGDLVFLGVAKRGVPVGTARLLVDGTAVAVGWSLGGPVGIGTLVVTLGLGPLIARAIRLFDLAPSRESFGRWEHEFRRAQALELQHELEGV